MSLFRRDPLVQREGGKARIFLDTQGHARAEDESEIQTGRVRGGSGDGVETHANLQTQI